MRHTLNRSLSPTHLPPVYVQRIQIMHRLSVVTLICVIGIFFFAVLFLVSIFAGQVSIPCFFAAVVFLIPPVVFYQRYEKHPSKLPPYRLPCSTAPDELSLRCNAAEMEPGAYVGLQQFRGMNLRCVILTQDYYDANSLKETRKRINRRFNRQHPSPSELTLTEQGSRLRLNIVVLNHSDEQLEHWVCGHTETLLRRGEAIVNIGVLIDQQQLLVPALMRNLPLIMLKKYRTAVEFADQLSL